MSDEVGNINNQMGQFLQSLDFNDMVLPNNFRKYSPSSRNHQDKSKKNLKRTIKESSWMLSVPI